MPAVTPAEMRSYFRRLDGGPKPAGLEAMEAPEPQLTDAAIKDRVDRSRDELLKLLERLFGPDPTRKADVEELVRQGGEGLRMLANNDGERLGANPAAAGGLEAIVRTNGSRPSFLINEGDIDFTTSPVGTWGVVLRERADALRRAVACVGRVNSGSGVHQGTGFLVGPDVILTNRHVLQLVAAPQGDGWKVKADSAIDFGHEFEGRKTLNRRKLKEVVFWGDRTIDFELIDHAKLDLALIELEPLPGGPDPFAVQSVAPALANPGVPVVTVGYPGQPSFTTYPLTLLDKLFVKGFGYKRLAPGETMASTASREGWTLGHDATTLGGNSGSVVFALTREGVALGLHYGGRPSGPAENWSIRLDLALGRTNGQSPATLAEVLGKYGVKLSDPAAAAAPPPAAPAVPTAGAAGPKPVTRADMVHLPAAAAAAGVAEAAGDGETSAADLADREGYDPNFIPGFPIPLRLDSGAAANDMRTLKDGSGVELKYTHFSTVVSVSRRMPLLTACNIDGAATRSMRRLTRWSYDGRLDRAHQWGNELYQGRDNPLDRGHMVRREDPVWGTPEVAARANADTFHYTNSCPQMGTVNQQVWLGLENYVLQHARRDQMRISVFTGPFLTRDDPEYRGGRIPLSFWKVVAFLLPTGRPSATAYRVSQERELEELEFVFGGYKTFQISVRQVADGTGLDFSALLPFDGFSHHEATTGERVVNRIDRLDQILV